MDHTFKPSETQVEKIKDSLRDRSSPSLQRRRAIVLLSAIGAIDFAIISLYQAGVIRHMPDLPFKLFDSDGVNASRKAYSIGLPDGTTGILMFGLNMILATYGGSHRSGRSKWLALPLAASVFAGALGAVNYLRDMIFKQKKICLYCLTGAFLSMKMSALAYKELKESFS